jgi:hypothetical protein
VATIAWIAILAIAFATLRRVGFAYSIYFKLSSMLMGLGMKSYAHSEHIFAFALLGALFTVACPRRLPGLGHVANINLFPPNKR